jgi:ABC-type lipoprotein release transport system permease subunit
MNQKNAFFKLAFRNITRNANRNKFVIASIAMGLSTLFWMKSIFSGHNQNMIQVATTTFIGSVQIHNPNFLKSKSVLEHFPTNELDQLLSNIKDISVTKRIYFPALISTANDSSLGQIYGIDPVNEEKITELKNNLVRGSYLTNETDATCTLKEIYISEKLSEKLKADLGDKIVLMGQAVDGTTGNDLFRVTGIFNTGSGEFDQNHSFIHLNCASDLASLQNRVHEVTIQPTVNSKKTDIELQEEIKTIFKSHEETKGLEVTTWREFLPSLATMVRVNAGVMNMITFIFFLVITLGVVNSMLMSIFERTKEFGVMLALGVTPGQVRKIIFYESLMLALLAAAVGTVIGFAVVSYHHHYGFDITPFIGGKNKSSFVGFKFKPMVYPIIEWTLYLKLLFLEISFIVLAGLYPAAKAARVEPIESIRS